MQNIITDEEKAISYRQWLAGLAMQGLLANYTNSDVSETLAAHRALSFADSLIAAEKASRG